jgi:hypothetical protein
VIKLEGRAYRSEHDDFRDYLLAAPPFVSRTLVEVDGFIWQVHHDFVKTIAKLLHKPTIEEDDIYTAKQLGTSVALLHSLHWHRRGILQSSLFRSVRTEV